MEILERNYSDSLHAYSFSEDENENKVKILLRWNLLSRLSKITKGKLNQEDKIDQLIPKTSINISKIINPELGNKSMYLSELKVDGMKFPSTEDSIDDSLIKNMDNMGMSIPQEKTEEKLKSFYTNKLTSSPFNILKLKGIDLPNSQVTEKEFSYIEDSMYSVESDEADHYKMVRAVSLLALHKHVTENPSSPKERLIKGIDNLSKEITDEQEKKELYDYLMIYIDKPASRPLLVKEAELVVKLRSDKAGKGIPLWAFITIISLILVGGIVYSQRDNIKAAWNSTKDMKTERGNSPDFKTKKTFLQLLFTREGRKFSSKYMNDKSSAKSIRDFLSDFDLKKKEAEIKLERNDFDMKSFLNNFGK